MTEKLSTHKAAEYLGIKPARMRQIAQLGLVKYTIDPHGYRLYTKHALDVYRRNRRPRGRPPKK